MFGSRHGPSDFERASKFLGKKDNTELCRSCAEIIEFISKLLNAVI